MALSRKVYNTRGLRNTLFPEPVVAQRAPGNNDKYEIGQSWIDVPNQDAYTLTAYVSGNPVWIKSGAAEGDFTELDVTPGFFTYTGVGSGFTMTSDTASSIGVTGAVDLDITTATGDLNLGANAAAHTVVLGSTTGASATTIQTGTGAMTFTAGGAFDLNITGEFTIDTPAGITLTSSEAAADAVSLHASNAAGGITLSAGTEGLSLGNDVDITTISMGNGDNTVAQTVNIASGAAADDSSINILEGIATSGTQTLSILNGASTSTGQAVNIMTGGGSGTRVFNLATNSALATTIAIGDGILGNTISVGNGANTVAQTISIANGASAAASDVNILSGAGTVGAATLNMANNPRVTTVDIADVVPEADRTITIGGGLLITDDIDETINIGGGGITADGDEQMVRTISISNGPLSGISNALADASQIVNIAAGAVSDDGTGEASNTVNIASGANTTTNAASLSKVNIMTGAVSTAGNNAVNIGALNAAIAIDGSVGINTNVNANVLINTGTSTGTVTIGDAANTGAISINSSVASNFTAAAGDLSLIATAGSAIVSGGEAVIDGVQLTSVGGITATSGALAATTGLHVTQGAATAAVQVGAGAPSHNAPKGSLYLRTDGSTTNDRAYIAVDAAGTWTALTTVA